MAFTGRSWNLAQMDILFATINVQLRALGFEIRTVLMREGIANATSSQPSSSTTPTSITVRYHALLNLDDDLVAREHGSIFSPEELKLFSSIIERLLQVQTLSTADIDTLQRQSSELKRLSMPLLQRLLEKWVEEGWLLRTQRNYLAIAPRSFLELRALLEQLRESYRDDEDNDEGGTGTGKGALPPLPQTILHG